MTDISVKIDDDTMLRHALRHIYSNLSNNDFEAICSILSKSENRYIRDAVSLAISDTNHPDFIPLLEEMIKKETVSNLREDMEYVLSAILADIGDTD